MTVAAQVRYLNRRCCPSIPQVASELLGGAPLEEAIGGVVYGF